MESSFDEDEPFHKWLNKLKGSIELLEERSESKETFQNISGIVKQVLDAERSLLPSWVSNVPDNSLSKLISGADEAKVILRHISTPSAVASFQTFKGALSTFQALHPSMLAPKVPSVGLDSRASVESCQSVLCALQSLDRSTSQQLSASSPTNLPKYLLCEDVATVVTADSSKSKVSTGLSIMGEFFDSLSNPVNDGFLGLCSLADSQYRLQRASENDSHFLSSQISQELDRKNASEAQLVQREGLIRDLSNADSDSRLGHCFKVLQREMSDAESDLREAEAAEEAARLAYELAVERRRGASTRLNAVELFLGSAKSQQEILLEVNSKRLELDAYNKESAAKRIQLFEILFSLSCSFQKELIDQRLLMEIQDMLPTFVKHFESVGRHSVEDSNLTPEQVAVRRILFARIGAETIILWRQLLLGKISDELSERLATLKQVLVGFELEPGIDSSSLPFSTKEVFKRDSATIVLYSDGYTHDTPDDHVENQERVNSSVEALKALQMASLVRSANADMAKSDRSLLMLKCNDILAPPLWVLPLVHSPEYLRLLWSLVKEAKESDLCVPLEFSTEWESDLESSDESDVPSERITASRKLKKSIAWTNRLSALVDANDAREFSKLLTPDRGDYYVARAVYSQNKKRNRASETKISTNEIARQKKKTDEVKKQVAADSSSSAPAAPTSLALPTNSLLVKQRRTKSHLTSSVYKPRRPKTVLSVGTKVSTPYGRGVIEDLLPDGMIKAKMSWGAVATLNSQSFRIIRAENKISGLSADEIERVLIEEKDLILKGRVGSLTTSDGRFVFNDPFLTRVMQKLVDRVKIQKYLANALGIAQATLSLYMHGRTSRGVTAEIEHNMFRWISYFDSQDVVKSLVGFISWESDDDSTSEDDVAEDGPASSDDSEGDSAGNQVVLERTRKKKTFDEAFFTDIETFPSSKQPRPETTLKRQPQVHIPPPSVDPMEEHLRAVLRKLMKIGNLSQGQIAKYFVEVYKVEATQGTLSGWFLYKIKDPKFSSFRRCGIKFLQENKKYLSAEDIEMADQLARWECVPLIPHKLPSIGLASPGESSPGLSEVDVVAAAEVKGGSDGASANDSDSDIESVDEVEDGSNVPAAVSIPPAVLPAVSPTLSKKVATALTEENTSDSISLTADSISHSTDSVSHVDSISHVDSHINDSISHSTDSISHADSITQDFVSSQPPLKVEACRVIVNSVGAMSQPKTYVVKTVTSLCKAVSQELQRRCISQSLFTSEAELDRIYVKQPTMSRVLLTRTVTNSFKGAQICVLMLRWLKQSSKVKCFSAQKTAELCEYCSISSVAFADSKSFQQHISWCARKSSQSQGQEQKPSTNSSERAGESSDSSRPVPPSSPSATEQKNESSSSESSEEANCTLAESVLRKVLHLDPDDLQEYLNKTSTPQDPFLSRTEVTVVKQNVKKPIKLEVPKTKSTSTTAASPPMVMDSIIAADVIKADTFVKGFHYGSCEHCKETYEIALGNVLLCHKCPCVYHSNCAVLAAAANPTSQQSSSETDLWYCWKCRDCGAESAEIMTSEQKKSSDFLNEKWVLLYSQTLHRWRKGFIVNSIGDKELILVKWWRADNKGGKSAWVNIKSAEVLIAQPEDVDMKSKSRRRQSTGDISSRRSLDDKKRVRVPIFPMDSNDGGRPEDEDAKPSVKGSIRFDPGTKSERSQGRNGEEAMSDTYLSSQSIQAALCTAGAACRAVDICMSNFNTNVFTCTRPPGHHAGRYGCTAGCLSTGFCLLNNAVVASTYARVRWGLERIAIIDIDVHFGNGTAELCRNDSRTFFASVHMVYGEENSGMKPAEESQAHSSGFYPSKLGKTEVCDNYVSVGVLPAMVKSKKKRPVAVQREESSESDSDPDQPSSAFFGEEAMQVDEEALSDGPLRGTEAYRHAIEHVIVPQMERFSPQLLIISAGFDGFSSDPIGGELRLTLDDYSWSTKLLMAAMDRLSGGAGHGKVISLLEGGYDVSMESKGLARCVVAHVQALRET